MSSQCEHTEIAIKHTDNKARTHKNTHSTTLTPRQAVVPSLNVMPGRQAVSKDPREVRRFTNTKPDRITCATVTVQTVARTTLPTDRGLLRRQGFTAKARRVILAGWKSVKHEQRKISKKCTTLDRRTVAGKRRANCRRDAHVFCFVDFCERSRGVDQSQQHDEQSSGCRARRLNHVFSVCARCTAPNAMKIISQTFKTIKLVSDACRFLPRDLLTPVQNESLHRYSGR